MALSVLFQARPDGGRWRGHGTNGSSSLVERLVERHGAATLTTYFRTGPAYATKSDRFSHASGERLGDFERHVRLYRPG